MRYISGLHEGETIRNIYLCKGKRSAETRNGKPYDNVLLQDKTGTLDGKVWDPNSQGIADYDEKDFIEVYGEVINYNGNLQINIKQIRKAGEEEYNPADYMPTTEKSVDGMYEQLTEFIRHISNPYLKSLLEYFFVNKIHHRGGAAPQRRPAAGEEIVRRCGAAHVQVEMGMGVDEARQQQLPLHVDDRGLRRGDAAGHPEDLLVLHQHVRPAGAPSGHHCAPAKQIFHGKCPPFPG